MRTVPHWDEYFMDIAEVTATRSKDPSRQVGCVLVDADSHTVKSGGYNGMVAGVEETPTLWERPTKYMYVCHAEANAVAIAARNGVSVRGCTAYVTCMPCMACAKLLIQSGVTRVVTAPGEVASGYKEEFNQVVQLFKEVGVNFEHKAIQDVCPCGCGLIVQVDYPHTAKPVTD